MLCTLQLCRVSLFTIQDESTHANLDEGLRNPRDSYNIDETASTRGCPTQCTTMAAPVNNLFAKVNGCLREPRQQIDTPDGLVRDVGFLR